MSMNTYPFHTFGLILAPEICAHIIKFADTCDNMIPESVQVLINNREFNKAAARESNALPDEYKDPSDTRDVLEGFDINTVYCGQFTGTARTINSADGPTNHEFDYQNAYMACIELDRQPDLFDTAYQDANEIVRELLDKLTVENKPILPESLDITPFICEIYGTYEA